VIADSRIQYSDSDLVEYRLKEAVKIESIESFIKKLIQHVPPKNFKMIRYYGLYSRRTKKRLLSL